MKGIMFKEDLFKAVLEGKKTQTRRVINNIPPQAELIGMGITGYTTFKMPPGQRQVGVYPRYEKGETIYLKEPFFIGHHEFPNRIFYKYERNDLWVIDRDIRNRANPNPWKNKMFMPEKSARYFIEITRVRVERLQDITEEDARTEGIIYVQYHGFKDYLHKQNWFDRATDSFRTLWDSINKNWEYNPWVWVYEFELTEKS